MILSHRWLFRHLPELPQPAVVVQGLEQLGVEVAEVKSFGLDLGNVELVEVVDRTPHPDSDHLSLVDVRRGDQSVTRIVTGAANGFVGERLWYAPPGTTLPDGRTLEVMTLRGVESPGMLLSPEELGYRANTGDLWVWDQDHAIGTSFLDAIGGADTLYDLELTPNLAQYLQSVRHIAQELGAIWSLALNPLPQPFVYQSDPLAQVLSEDRCPLYGLVSLSIKPGGVSPLWMQTLLRAVGLRVIHPVVDVTNFVLWDVGEPLHAFDRRRVHGAIQVRAARPDESLGLLDGQTVTLNPDDLVIADERGPLALAGIIGGRDSAIAEDTTEILLECAHFAAPGIFATARSHHLVTDAEAHFGRGTDPTAVLIAPALVEQLLAQSGLLDRVDASCLKGHLVEERTVMLDCERIRGILGVQWADGEIVRALTAFGFGVVGNAVRVPRHRHDVGLIYDLAEEVARFYGLGQVPRTLPAGSMGLARRSQTVGWQESVRDWVAAAGYTEMVTRPFSSPRAYRTWNPPDDQPLMLTNPLREEESLLRGTVVESLIEVARYNRARHDMPIRIFELGSVFARGQDRVEERQELAVLLGLEPHASLWGQPQPSLFDLTGLADYLFERLGMKAERVPFSDPPTFLHPGRCQRIMLADHAIGYVGEIRPRLALALRMRRVAVLVLRIPPHWDIVAQRPGRPSRFPEVQRDLSVVVPETVCYADIVGTIARRQPPTLRMVRAIDQFVGEFGVSLTLRLIFQSDTETLTDAAVDQTVNEMVAALAAIGVERRQ